MEKTLALDKKTSELLSQIEQLKVELSMAIGERDELIFTIVKNLKMEYMLKLGNLEYRAYEIYCKSLRARRKLQMLQSALNRQEKIDCKKIEELEKTLDEEFAEYQNNLNQKMQDINDALKRSKAEFLSEEENAELKRLYRKIVKTLHPDINSNLTEQQLELYQNAVDAYDFGDLDTIRTIAEMIGDENFDTEQENSTQRLEEKITNLKTCIKKIRDEIEAEKVQFPYNQKPLLENEAKLEEKKMELKKLTEDYEELYSQYLAEIKKITDGLGN